MAEGAPLLLALDAGSTHCKAGIFDAEGRCLNLTSQPTPITRTPVGGTWIDPSALWQTVADLISILLNQADAHQVTAIGITSMAESGLLVERSSGLPRSVILPWFDLSSTPQANDIRQRMDPNQRYLVTGIYPSYKCGLAKILYARDVLGADLKGAIWLSTADFLAYQLSGVFCTDYSLAGRTYAFNVYEKRWDINDLTQFGVSSDLFPPVQAASHPAGCLREATARSLGLIGGIPVMVAGHDHVCAALAAGATQPGLVLDSIGTAETLCGAMQARPLGKKELQSGFSIGRHVTGDSFFWQGGLSSAGGALEWLRTLLPGRELDYDELTALLEQISDSPGEILFFPYLAGAGSPRTLPEARAAFIGMRSHHTLADLTLAVLEGTAYEIEWMRRQAEDLTGSPIHAITATGGGVRNTHWMQIKADVTGQPYQVTGTPEAALLGAAMLAGVGAGLYPDCQSAVAAVQPAEQTVYQPDPQRHARYAKIFERGFLHLQAPLRTYFASLAQS